MFSAVPTCKQGAEAVLCQNPAHHTYGGAGKLAWYWQQKASTQCYATPDPQTTQMWIHSNESSWLHFFASCSPSSTCLLVLTTSNGNVTIDAIWKKSGLYSFYSITFYDTFGLYTINTYRAGNCSWNEGNGECGLSCFVPLTQPDFALLVVVPVHGWKWHVSQECWSKTAPQRKPAFCLHGGADAFHHLPVRQFLGLQLCSDQLQRTDDCRWPS